MMDKGKNSLIQVANCRILEARGPSRKAVAEVLAVTFVSPRPTLSANLFPKRNGLGAAGHKPKACDVVRPTEFGS